MQRRNSHSPLIGHDDSASLIINPTQMNHGESVLLANFVMQGLNEGVYFFPPTNGASATLAHSHYLMWVESPGKQNGFECVVFEMGQVINRGSFSFVLKAGVLGRQKSDGSVSYKYPDKYVIKVQKHWLNQFYLPPLGWGDQESYRYSYLDVFSSEVCLSLAAGVEMKSPIFVVEIPHRLYSFTESNFIKNHQNGEDIGSQRTQVNEVMSYLVMLYYGDVDLFDLINDEIESRIQLGFDFRIKILLALWEGLETQCHHRGIVHLDVKPDNIRIKLNLVNRTVVSVRYLDYSFSKRVDHVSNMPAGTLEYAAIEALEAWNPGKPADVYSLMITTGMLCRATQPIHQNLEAAKKFAWTATLGELFHHINIAGLDELPLSEAHRQRFDELVKQGLAAFISKRPTTHEVIKKLRKIQVERKCERVAPHDGLTPGNIIKAHKLAKRLCADLQQAMTNQYHPRVRHRIKAIGKKINEALKSLEYHPLAVQQFVDSAGMKALEAIEPHEQGFRERLHERTSEIITTMISHLDQLQTVLLALEEKQLDADTIAERFFATCDQTPLTLDNMVLLNDALVKTLHRIQKAQAAGSLPSLTSGSEERLLIARNGFFAKKMRRPELPVSGETHRLSHSRAVSV